MAITADSGIGSRCFVSTKRTMRIMASSAEELAFGAFEEAGRLAKPVDGVDDFELLLVARSVIEVERVVGERLTGLVGEDASIESLNCVGKGETGGLEVALHADFELRGRSEAFRIEDGGADFFLLRALGIFERKIDVLRAGAMAAFAIDAFGQLRGEEWFHAGQILSWSDGRIGVVAEHAVVGDSAAGVGVGGVVKSGTHCPIAAVGGIPGDGQFDESVFGGAMDITAGMIAGAHDIVNLKLLYVGLATLIADLVSAKEEGVTAADHLIVAIGGLVMDSIVFLEVLDAEVGCCGGVERAAHSGLLKCFGDLSMAGGTGGLRSAYDGLLRS
jgi:hypothetical protein